MVSINSSSSEGGGGSGDRKWIGPNRALHQILFPRAGATIQVVRERSVEEGAKGRRDTACLVEVGEFLAHFGRASECGGETSRPERNDHFTG